MLKFGIIAEGPTDQTVLENIILGYFQDQDDEPSVNFIQPPRPLTETPSGWGHVFKSLERNDCEGALQFNDFVVIHIDTDVSTDYDVPRYEAGNELSPPELVDRVIARLKKEIDSTFYEANAQRILFAIAVDSIECWLLPLLYNDNKAAKVTGCLEAANRELRKKDRKGLSAGATKFPKAYDEASSRYRKRKTLLELRDKNPSLELFITKLDALRNTVPPNVRSDSSDQSKAD